MALKEGTRVKVMFNAKDPIKDASRQFQGQELTIKRKARVKGPQSATMNIYNGLYYELEGATGKDGVPYVFLEDALVPIDV